MIFSSFFALLGKNFKIFFRSRFASFFVILLPLLIVLFAGYSFGSDNFSGVVVAVNTYSSNNLTENIILNIKEKGFLVEEYNSLEGCINSVKMLESQVCLYLPDSLSYDVNSEEIVFYVDYSRINIVHELIGLVEEGVYSESFDIGSLLVQRLIDNLVKAKSSLEELRDNLFFLSEEVQSFDESIESFENPSLKLDEIISDLESYENSSEISSEIDSLNELKTDVSLIFEELDSSHSNLKETFEELNLIIEKMDLIIKNLDELEIHNAGEIISPINTKIESVISENNKRDFLIPSIISLISLFGAILLSSTLVLKNKKTKAYFRNFVTPTSDFSFVISTFFTSLLLIIFQFIFVFVGLYFIFEMNFFALPLELLSVLILGWGAFISIGMFLGYLFQSEETVVFSSVLISSVLMFFSNLILPLENISGSLFRAAQFNPFVVLENSLRKIYLFNLGFDSLILNLLLLGGLLFLFIFLNWIMIKLTKRRL